MSTDADVPALIENAYSVFSGYGPGRGFCTFCYSDTEIEYITKTPVRDLDVETSRKLLWETGDHWPSPEAYRHYLPRMLEVLAPPFCCEDLYPAHLCETLNYHLFRQWPQHEQTVVEEFLAAVTKILPLNDEDREEWVHAQDKL